MFAYIIYVNDLRIGSQAVQLIFFKLGISNIHETLNLLIRNIQSIQYSFLVITNIAGKLTGT